MLLGRQQHKKLSRTLTDSGLSCVGWEKNGYSENKMKYRGEGEWGLLKSTKLGHKKEEEDKEDEKCGPPGEIH